MKANYLVAALIALGSTSAMAHNTNCEPHTNLTGTYEGSQICPSLSQKGYASDTTPTNTSTLYIKHHVGAGKIQVFADYFTTGYNGFLVQSTTDKDEIGMAVASCRNDDKLDGFINEILVGLFNTDLDGNLLFTGDSTLGGTETAADFPRAAGRFMQKCTWSYTRVSTEIPDDIKPLFEGNICKNITPSPR